MTTEMAFEQLLNNRELCSSIGMKSNNYNQIRKRLRDNDPMLTIQTKIQWLHRAGYKYKMTWKKKK